MHTSCLPVRNDVHTHPTAAVVECQGAKSTAQWATRKRLAELHGSTQRGSAKNGRERVCTL
eukprot:1485168-Pyramimonas_sp.AAC.1